MRRTFVRQLHVGPITLESAESHHLRDVLRLEAGTLVELFDAAGRRATGLIKAMDRLSVVVMVTAIDDPVSAATAREICVASAVPKADRADWLVEKLSEVGVARWLPLRTARSVVHPEGTSKYERWRRLAVEAAKQSRRNGVMAIEELSTLVAALERSREATSKETVKETTAVGASKAATKSACPADSVARYILSTREDIQRLNEALASSKARTVWLFIGPEGGWTPDELGRLIEAGVVETSLTLTTLRIETAAVVAAGIASVVTA